MKATNKTSLKCTCAEVTLVAAADNAVVQETEKKRGIVTHERKRVCVRVRVCDELLCLPEAESFVSETVLPRKNMRT